MMHGRSALKRRLSAIGQAHWLKKRRDLQSRSDRVAWPLQVLLGI